MTVDWRKLTAKFDALTLRERAIVFAGSIAVTVIVFDFMALEPLAVKQRRDVQQIAEVRSAIRTLDDAAKVQRSQPDPDIARRAYRDALRKQIAEIDREMQGMQAGLVPPGEMVKVLEGMLARNRGLTLVALRKLPMQRFDAPGAPKPDAAAPAAGDAKPATAQPERSIYQHGFEVKLEGSYSELHDYLERLEKLPWRMFWGGLNVNAAQHPKLTLTLTVYTLSVNKAWLIV